MTEYTITVHIINRPKPETFSMYGKSKSEVTRFVKGVYRNRLLSVVTSDSREAEDNE